MMEKIRARRMEIKHAGIVVTIAISLGGGAMGMYSAIDAKINDVLYRVTTLEATVISRSASIQSATETRVTQEHITRDLSRLEAIHQADVVEIYGRISALEKAGIYSKVDNESKATWAEIPYDGALVKN